MRFERIEAERCGGLTGLQIPDLAPGLNVVLGPNGSGKTSLLRFVGALLDDAANCNGSPQATPTAAGWVDLQVRNASVRVLRIPRPGHPDTVAIVAAAAAEIEQFRRQSRAAAPETVSLVQIVESSALHQTSPLATIATDLTRELCARELGANWSLVESMRAMRAADNPQAAPLIDVVRRLAEMPETSPAAPEESIADQAVIHSNWRVAIGALAQQREQLRLEWETRIRMQSRQQREWETQLRWLCERADRQLLEINQLDADWQSAACDVHKQFAGSPESTRAGNGALPGSAAPIGRDADRRLVLLAQVLEDLAQDRLHVTLQLAQSSTDAIETLESERQRIDGCEREIVSRMQHLRRGRHFLSASGIACVCPTCGTSQSSREEPVGTLTSPPDVELTRRATDLHRRLSAARTAHASTCRRMARIDARRRRSADDASADRLRFDMNTLDSQIAELERRRRVELAAWAIALRRHIGRRHDVLQRAGQHLSTLTSGRYVSLRRPEDCNELLAAGADGEWTPTTSLSRGTSEQIAMSLRLALLQALSDLDQPGPALWDEPLADSDEQRLEAAAALLAAYGRSGGQLLVFTCREHVARAMQAAGAVVHRLGCDLAETPQAATTLTVTDVADEPPTMPATGRPTPAVPIRVLPGSSYWLHHDASLDQVPSIGQQMARRLRALGVSDVRDLLEFDPAAAAVSLEDVQISAAHVQIWRAEARLLTETPELTGRDAQLLVSCGVLTRGQLAAANVNALTKRIDRLRGGDTLRWRFGASTAPHRETIQRWVESARGLPPDDPATRTNSTTDRTTSPRRRRGRPAPRRSQQSRSPAPTSPPAVASRFRLQPDSAIVDAPSIGQKTARRLQRVGVATVQELLACDPQQTAARMRHRRITAETVVAWQQQAGLMCSVPDLRCADAIVLVACGIAGPRDLQRISAAALWATLEPLLASGAGQRLLRGASAPTFEDVSRWIGTVEESRVRRAA